MFFSWERRTLGHIALSLGLLLLAACGPSRSTHASQGEEKPHVIAAFYALQYATERVAGDHATVDNLTKPGTEPHDLELSPRDIATLEQADLVIYLRGFQPAVDEGVALTAADHSLEVSRLANLSPSPSAHGHDDAHPDGEHDHSEPADSPAGLDPHFWLDPLRLARVADGIARRLSELDPHNARVYERNAAQLRKDLVELDREYHSRLAACASRDLVTSHRAFGYLAERYGFEQAGLAGLSPEQEPSPAELGDLARYVRQHDVRTIYHETLVSSTIAETLAREVGVQVAVLDPLEGLTDASAGNDYLDVMRANLDTLQKGQSC
ncbi:MAG TPA: zinc ABC transporter substrate-binding protein [Actinopolymorphaceae bacterium]